MAGKVHLFEVENIHESSVFDSEDISRAGDTLSGVANTQEYFQQVERGELPFFSHSAAVLVPTLRNANGETLLITAARLGHASIVERLIPDIEAEEADNDGWTALLNAAQHGHTLVVKKLLAAGALVDAADLVAWTPLMWACYKNRVNVVDELLKAKANANATGEDDGLTPLIIASGRGYTEIVHKLLAAGAHVNTGDKFGSTPLIWASRKGYSHIVTELLTAGAELDVIGMQASTALMLACRGNHLKVVNMLLAREPNVNVVDYNGLSALGIAAREGYTEVAQALIHAGAFVNLVDRFGNSILASAVRSGNIHTVRMLLERHADVNTKDSEGRTPLHLAIDKSFAEIVVALLERKPNLEMRSRDGDTALLRTVKNRDVGLCQLLVNMGAKIGAVDNGGDNSLHLALRARSRRLTQILLVNPSDSKLLYRPNKLGETPYSIDAEALRPILPTIFGPIGTDVDLKSLLGFDIYADVLADVLCEPNLALPLTVGLYAKWGSGKSLLLPKIRESMKAFSRSWLEGAELYWSWSLILVLLLLCSFTTLIAVAIVAASGQPPTDLLYPSGIGCITFVILLCAYGFIYYGSEVRLWNTSISTARLIAKAVARFRILISVITLNAPMRSSKELVVRPVSFLFADDHRLSFIGGEQSLTNMVLSLFTAAEQHFGAWTVRSLSTFHHIHPNRPGSRLQTLCGMPVLLNIFAMMLALALSLAFFVSYSLREETTSYAVASVIFLGMFFLASLPLLHFLLVRLLVNLPKRRINRITHKMHLIPFERVVSKLQKEVDLLVSIITTLDAFTNSQTRLVVTVDGLDSVEQGKMVQILDALTLFFSSRPNSPFIVIYAMDPQIIIAAIQHNLRGGVIVSGGGGGIGSGGHVEGAAAGSEGTTVITGNDYLKNVISMPFFLDHMALKSLQGMYSKRTPHGNYPNIGGGFNSSMRERKKSETFRGSRLSLREQQKDRGAGGGGDLVPGSIALAAQADLNLFPSHDYFSNMNPRALRRIVNSIALSGRLLRTFEVDFSWIALYNWVSMVEQWPYSMCYLLESANEAGEDPATTLPDLYHRIKGSMVLVDAASHDRNMAEFEEILAKMIRVSNNKQQQQDQQQLLTVGQARAFAPCTSNLNPQLRKIVSKVVAQHGREATLREGVGKASIEEAKDEVPSTKGGVPNELVQCLFDDPSTWERMNDKPFVRMSIEEVTELVKHLQIPGERMAELVKRFHINNLNGLVLSSCELTELRRALDVPLGDWTLIQLLIETLRQWRPNIRISPAAAVADRAAGEAQRMLGVAVMPNPAVQALPSPQLSEYAKKQSASLHSIDEGLEPIGHGRVIEPPLVEEEESAPYTNEEKIALLDKREHEEEFDKEELKAEEGLEEGEDDDADGASTKSIAGSTHSLLRTSTSPPTS